MRPLNNMKSYGGEGKMAYRKSSSDSGLPQHGGEGSVLKKKSDTKLLHFNTVKYCGPGRYLGVKSSSGMSSHKGSKMAY